MYEHGDNGKVWFHTLHALSIDHPSHNAKNIAKTVRAIFLRYRV
jgi:hypothetical protein